MRRGFKTQAERVAASVREGMGLRQHDLVSPYDIADHMGVTVRQADELVDRSRLQALARIQRDAFSAATFQMPTGRTVVVTNPLNSAGRVNSDLAHELSHLLLEHDIRQVERINDLSFFTCDAEQEEEANWLGGCLLLPRQLLLRAARKDMTPKDIASDCKVSVPMARFRLNASGVLIQVAREGKRRRR